MIVFQPGGIELLWELLKVFTCFAAVVWIGWEGWAIVTDWIERLRKRSRNA